jgi:PRTRC genetic system protein A
VPPNEAVAYPYVLAAAGVYLRAENSFFDVLAPIAGCQIRGLAHLQPHFRLNMPSLSVRLLDAVLSDARQVRCRNDRLKETLYHFQHDNSLVRVIKPLQRETAANVVAIEGSTIDVILDLHSHGNLGAFWSGMDNGNEQGFRVYGVIGRLDTKPEIRLRPGVYGTWFPLPVSLLFDGPGDLTDVINRSEGEQRSKSRSS